MLMLLTCRMALRAGGLSEDDQTYTTKHEAVLRKLMPSYQMPQGKEVAGFMPMSSSSLPESYDEPKAATTHQPMHAAQQV